MQLVCRFRLPAFFCALAVVAFAPHLLWSYSGAAGSSPAIACAGCLLALLALPSGAARGESPRPHTRATRSLRLGAGRQREQPSEERAAGSPNFAGWRTGGRGLIAAATVYSLLLAAVSWKHTFWRDEAQAWLISRSSTSLVSVVHNVRYEGHPPLWHFVLYFISRFTWNPEWMKVPNYLFSVAAAVLILSAAKAPAWVRLGFVFSYFMLFEYAVIDRNYMIGVMFLLAAHTLGKDDPSGLKISIALSLAAFTSLPALVVALCLYPVHLACPTAGPGVHGPRRGLADFGIQRAVAPAIFSASILAALAVIRPPKDAGTLPTIGQWVWLQHLFRFSDITQAYLPIPGELAFWNSSLFFDMGRWVSPAIGLALAIPLCLWFRQREARYFFFVASTLLVAEMAIANVFQMRHVGWLFIVFLLAVMIEYEAAPSHTPSGSPHALPWRSFLLGVVLAVQVATGLFVSALSLCYPFSVSKEVATFLRQRHLDHAPIVFFPDVIGGAVLAYMQRPNAYSVERGGLVSFMVWDRVEARPRHLPSKAEVSAAAENGSRPIVIASEPLPGAEASALGVRRIASFGGGLGGDGQYYVYR